MTVNIGPEIVLSRERRVRRRGAFGFLAAAVALTTVVLLINPATTQEYAPVCGVEAHEHGPECYETVLECVCPLEESIPHTHTEDCYETSEAFICGMEDDPEHVHTDECIGIQRTLICGMEEREQHIHSEDCILREEVLVCDNTDPEHEHTEKCYSEKIWFLCEDAVRASGAAHVHGELCYAEHQVLVCDKPEHTHTDGCYPELTGDPHADVEIDLDWESTFCDVEKTGIWAEDLVAIARSQIGYAESELNFITDEYNVRHGYTRYGDWYGNRYVGWNALYVMFCLHYADVWGIPTDSVPANWMNAARAQGFWTEANGEPVMGDLVFFDDNADEIADRVAIVTGVRADEIDILYGGTGTDVHEETFPRFHEKIAGYLALPTNPDYVTLEEKLPENAEQPERQTAELLPEEILPEGQVPLAPLDPHAPVLLTAETEDGLYATLSALQAAFPYPADELVLKVSEVPAYDPDVPSGVETVKEAVKNEGEIVIGERYLDISVWHLEKPEAAVPDEAPAPVDSGDLPGDVLPVNPAAEFAGDEPLPTLPVTDEPVPGDTEIVIDDPASYSSKAIPGEDELTPVPASGPAAYDPYPSEEIPETEPELVRISPSGPVEITVEGLWGDGNVRVYRIGGENTAEELFAAPDQTAGRITVTTSLN